MPPDALSNSDDDLHTHAVLPLQGTYIPHDRISTQGLKTIGAPIGTDEFISEQVHKQCRKYPKFIPRLYKMDPECAIFILRDCHLPIATHLIRMLHPTHTIEHAHELDGDIFSAYQHLADDFDIKITDPMYFQPFKHSGLGFRSIATTAPIAYYASRLQCIRTFQLYDPTIAEHAQNILRNPPDPPPTPSPARTPSTHASPSISLSLPDSLMNSHTPSSISLSLPDSLMSPHTPPTPHTPHKPASAPRTLAASNQPHAQKSSPAAEGKNCSTPSTPHAHCSTPSSPDAPAHPQAQESQSAADESIAQDYQQPTHPALKELAYAWQTAHEHTPELHDYEDSILPHTEQELMEALQTSDFTAIKLQNALTQQVEAIKAEAYFNRCSPLEKARMKSTATSSASAPLTACPSWEVRMSSTVVSRLHRYRCGTLRLPCKQCVCGKSTLTPAHVLSCKKLRGRFVRHDVVVKVLLAMAARAGVVACSEVMVVEGSQKRMDLVLHFPGERVWVDVTFVNPQASSYVGRDGLLQREKDKLSKWVGEARRAGVRMVPFVIDTFGTLGEQAVDFLRKLSEHAWATNPHLTVDVADPLKWMGNYRRSMVVEIGKVVANANHAIIDEACIKAVRPRAPTQSLYRALFRLYGARVG